MKSGQIIPAEQIYWFERFVALLFYFIATSFSIIF